MKKFKVAYYSKDGTETHSYQEPWSKTELFCPRCGSKDVWFEDSGGDFYVGELHLCVSCKGKFYLPDGVEDATNKQDEQRLQNLSQP